MIRSFIPSEYFPTTAYSGNSIGRVFRMQNLIIRGETGEPYAEVYGGSLDLAEDIPVSTITGTVAVTAGSFIVTGTGTAFKTELHLGQRLEAYGGTGSFTIPMVVDQIISDTSLRVCRAPAVTSTGASVAKLPRMYEIDRKRGTSETGNVIQMDLGTLLGVGSGTFRVNGAVLPGTSLVLTRAPQIAIFNPTTGNYAVYTLGMAVPTTLTAGNGAAGVKNMQGAVYSIRVMPGRKATHGYNNPSPKAEVTLVTGNQIRITNISAADTTNGQDLWLIVGSLYTQQGGINGPWYFVKEVEIGAGAGQIAAAGGAISYDFEYNDAEISGENLLTLNNDAPPHAEFVAEIGTVPTWLSCRGPGDTSPGPMIAPGKRSNIEAVPSRTYVATSLPDVIVGFAIAEGRLYLQCASSLQITVDTQSQDPRIPPVVCRPFWKAGFYGPDSLIFVNGYLIGMTKNGLARSIASGDEGSEEFGFATAVEAILQSVNPGHCLIQLDPKNNAVCLFISAYNQNASGFWTTRVLMYGLRENRWIGDVLLTSTTTDMIVSGAAAVGDRLEFLAGGRTAAGTTVVKSYRWDDPAAAVAVPWYLAWQFSDWGAEDRPKHIGPLFQLVGKIGAGGTAGVYGAEPGSSIPVTALEAGVHATSPSGTITLPASSTVTTYDTIELNIDNLKQFTVRVDGTWAGTGERDRIDEVVVQAEVTGARR